MDFTIHKVKSTRLLNKSEDLSGFQGQNIVIKIQNK